MDSMKDPSPVIEKAKAKLMRMKVVYPTEQVNGEAQNVNCVAEFESRDGEHYLIQGTFQGELKFWCMATEKLKDTIITSGTVQSIVSVNNGINFLTCNFDGAFTAIVLWDFNTKSEVRRIISSSFNKLCFEMLHTPALMAMGTGKHQGYLIYLFSVFDLVRIKSFKGHNRTINAICYLHDKETIVSADYNGFILFMNYRTGKLKKKLNHSGGVLTLKFNKNKKVLYSGGIDGSICLWDALFGYMISKIDNYHVSWVRSLLSIDHYNALITSGDDCKSNIFDVTDPKKAVNIWKVEDFDSRNEVIAIFYSEKQKKIYFCTNERTIKCVSDF